MDEDAQLRLKREIQSLPMPPPESEKEYNACDCYNNMAEALSGMLDPHHIDGTPEIIDSQRGWLPESDPRWGMLSQMLANYRMTLANPLANYNADGREDGKLSSVAEQIASSYSSYFAAAYSYLMAYVLSEHDAEAHKKVQTTILGFYAQNFRTAVALQAALIGATLGPDEKKLMAARKLLAQSPIKEWASGCELPAAISILRKWLEAIEKVRAAGNDERRKLYDPIRNADITGLTTLNGVIAIQDQIEQANQTVMKKRRASGCCAMCGKPLGIWSRIFLAKAHSSCARFIDETNLL